ncbi:MAG: DHH family phosphoesterase [Bacilli bacterium]|nr:DHH family phosphoesterase [Bacilli bacterium]
MVNKIFKLRIAILVIAVIELLSIGFLTLFYLLNVFNFADVPYIESYIFLAFFVFILIDLIFYVASINKINKLRTTNDIAASSLIGSDLQEAYDFGAIGIVVIGDNNIVIWTNSFIQKNFSDIVDTNILDLSPELNELLVGPVNKVVNIEQKGRIYKIKYIADSHIFIFQDITEHQNSVKYSREQRTVLGLIQIDNAKDVASDTDELVDATNKIRSLITEYFRQYNVLIRHIGGDRYFAVCNYTSLEQMEKNKFSLLDAVRDDGAKEGHRLTLSMGFSYDIEDIDKLDEMARNAYDLALSRGGDQCVVSQYGKENRFFGGKTTALESTSKVKLRSLADSLLGLIKDSSGVYVMGHKDMDMDALGACLGTMCMAEFQKKPCRIIYDPRLVESKTRDAFSSNFEPDVYNRMIISPNEAIKAITPETLLVVVDISVPTMTMCPELLIGSKSYKTVVIDHHRRGNAFPESPSLSYVDTASSSASEIFAEMIHYASANPPIPLNPTYATFMLSGIFLDSNYFKSKVTGARTFDACEILKSYGADNSKADDFLKDAYEEFKLVNSIANTLTFPKYGVGICMSDDKLMVERAALAKVGNQIMSLKDVNAVFVIGKTEENTVRLSARSDGTVNVSLLCEKMGGGGHFTSSACAFEKQSVDKVYEIVVQTLDTYLDDARNVRPGEGGN